MGLRCLLGHDFGPAEIEREREEDGNEMVLTIREVKTCRRCGEQQIVSENKEVTSIRTPGEVGLSTADETSAGSGDVGPGVGETGGASSGGTGALESTAPGSAAADSPADGETPSPGASGVDDDAVAGSESNLGAGSSAAVDDGSFAETGELVDESDDAAIFIDDAEDGGAESEDAERAESEEARAGGVDAGAADDQGSATPAREGAPDESGEAADGVGTGEDDGVILDEDDERQPGEWPDADAELERPSTDVDVAAEMAGAAAEDEKTDAEFIDAEEPERDGPVPWPEHDDVTPEEPSSEPTPWPEVEGEDEGFSAELSDGTPTEMSFGGGLTPESEDTLRAGPEAGEYVEAPAEAEGRTRTESVEFARAERTGRTGSDTEFYCPSCNTRWDTSNSSMRPGDICPDCRRGYVGERER